MSRNLLGGWTPRDTAHQLQRITRHTSLVAMSKYGLIALAVILIIFVFIIPALHDSDDGARLVFTNIEVSTETAKPRMMTPRYQGMDEELQPYNISAEYAERQDDGRILLHKIDADITLKSKAWVAVIADEGVFDSVKKTMDFPSKINIFHNDGYEMRTTVVHVNLENSTASGQQPVEIQGSIGTLKADGFNIDTVKKTMYFAPNVKVRIHPHAN